MILILSCSLYVRRGFGNDYIYRMVKVQVQQYLTKPNHCIWKIRTHYTFVSTNEQFAPEWRWPCHGTAAFNYYHPIYMILDCKNLWHLILSLSSDVEAGGWSRVRSTSAPHHRRGEPCQSWSSPIRLLIFTRDRSIRTFVHMLLWYGKSW